MHPTFFWRGASLVLDLTRQLPRSGLGPPARPIRVWPAPPPHRAAAARTRGSSSVQKLLPPARPLAACIDPTQAARPIQVKHTNPAAVSLQCNVPKGTRHAHIRWVNTVKPDVQEEEVEEQDDQIPRMARMARNKMMAAAMRLSSQILLR